MSNSDTWFLLVQYRHRGRTSVTEFQDLSKAVVAYNEAERAHKDKMAGSDPEMDVLLVGASSLEVVKDRYPSYFEKEKSRSAKVRRLLDLLPTVEDSAPLATSH